MSHSLKKLTLSIISLNHEANGLSEAYDTFFQTPGNILFWNAIYISSSYWDITAKPWIAFFNSPNVLLTVRRRLLNLANYCKSTMESECMWPSSFVTKCDWLPYDSNNRVGTCYVNCSAISITISSGVLPLAALLILGWMDRMVSIILFDYWFWYVILAFSCIPNTYGSSKFGRPWIYYKYDLWFP